MAKKKHLRKHSSRRNPSDTLLVNPRHGGKSRRVRRKRNPGGLIAKVKSFILGSKRRSAKRSSKRRNPLLANPLLANPRRRKHAKRRNPLLANPRKARRHGKRKNPLLANPRHRRKSAKRKNPLLANPRHHAKHRRHAKRKNPAAGVLAMPGRLQKGVQKFAGSIPLVGGLLGGAIGVIGGAVGGAIGVLPTAYAMPYVAKYVPDMLKPVGYSIAGALLSSAIRLIPVKIPYKAELAVGVAAAGGAVDMYRWQHGKSQDLGDEYGDLDDPDMGDEYGDDEVGDDGSALAAIEFADADLADAAYLGDDFTGDEMAAADVGRRHFWQRFRPKPGEPDEPVAEGVSEHAGKEGRRLGFLIYWLGFDNVKRLMKLPEQKRRDAIAHMKHESGLRAAKLLEQRLDTSMQQAETAGLLVAS